MLQTGLEFSGHEEEMSFSSQVPRRFVELSVDCDSTDGASV